MYRAMGLPYSHAFELLDVYPVRAQFHSDFKSPAYLDDLLAVELCVDKIGGSSIKVDFRIVRAASEKGQLGETLVTGYCVMVTVDRTTLKPRRVPDRLRDALAPFVGK